MIQWQDCTKSEREIFITAATIPFVGLLRQRRLLLIGDFGITDLRAALDRDRVNSRRIQEREIGEDRCLGVLLCC